MILISSHLDRVIQDFDLSYNNGVMTGLLDNILGVFISYAILLDDQNLIELEKKGGIKIWHGKGEEWGAFKNEPKLKKDDIVICVDVASGARLKGYDFSIENIKVKKQKEFNAAIKDLRTEGLKFKTHYYKKGLDPYIWEDESWRWIEKGISAMTFIIPIKAKNDGWHSVKMDNTVKIEQIKIAAQGLKRLINHL